MVYELPEDDHAAAAEAKKIFLLDVDVERREGSSIDPNNTWWDAGGQYGQLTWTGGRRATYDVTCTCPLPQTEPKQTKIMATIKLSTAHLKPETRAWMADNEENYPWYSTEGGFFILTSDTKWLFDLPADLERCFAFAKEHGADYIEFDQDEAPESGLPQYTD